MSRSAMAQLRMSFTLAAMLACSSIAAKADVVLDWNAIAVTVTQPPGPFQQARFMAIVQLAVFEAVNAITNQYEPYLGTVTALPGASADAAAGAAAYHVLKHYFPLARDLDRTYNAWLAAIPDSAAKSAGVATGEDAAAQMIARRFGDGSSPPRFYMPASREAGLWQPTATCPPAGGVGYQWQNITPFGVASEPGSLAWIEPFDPGPPPALTSARYARDYNEVKRVGSAQIGPDARPQGRADVARFYNSSSPSFVFNLAARQAAAAEGRSLSKNARDLALLNMATSDSLVASFWAKYRYQLWRPETAVREGDIDGNRKTDADASFAPYVLTPCFPSYPSNHGSASNGAAEVLRRIYGAGGHAITMSNPDVPGVTLHYTTFDQITDDISDARVYGGIHFRFDQDAGAALGREIGAHVYKHNLRPHHSNPDQR